MYKVRITAQKIGQRKGKTQSMISTAIYANYQDAEKFIEESIKRQEFLYAQNVGLYVSERSFIENGFAVLLRPACNVFKSLYSVYTVIQA